MTVLKRCGRSQRSASVTTSAVAPTSSRHSRTRPVWCRSNCTQVVDTPPIDLDEVGDRPRRAERDADGRLDAMRDRSVERGEVFHSGIVDGRLPLAFFPEEIAATNVALAGTEVVELRLLAGLEAPGVEVHEEQSVQIADAGFGNFRLRLVRPHLEAELFHALNAQHEMDSPRLTAKVFDRLAHAQVKFDRNLARLGYSTRTRFTRPSAKRYLRRNAGRSFGVIGVMCVAFYTSESNTRTAAQFGLFSSMNLLCVASSW